MQKLGQHFLKNTAALQLIVNTLDLKSNETIIEIGPGHGELIKNQKSETKNLKWIAIEKDPGLAQQLKNTYEGNPQVEIVEGDALRILKLPAFGLHLSIFKLVGNIPYYITGHLLRILGELERKPALCVFTIQKEVAERIVAEPPRMNRLAASVQFWAEPKILKILPAEDFSPPPKVDSAIIKLEAKDQKSETEKEKYYRIMRMLFAQPRKTILNNLEGERESKKEIIELLRTLNLDPNDRPQNLNIKDIASIAALF